MKQRLFFCADLGTSSLKAALIDNAGRLRGFARVPFINAESAPSWLEAFNHAAEQLAAAAVPGIESGSLCPVSALIISGNGPTLVPVKWNAPEGNGLPKGEISPSGAPESLRPIFWYDSIPAPETEAPSNESVSSFFLPKVKASLAADPQAFAGVRYFFSSQEWLSWKLGARPVTVLPHDGYVPYYWDDDQCQKLGIGRELFPPFATMGEAIGEVHPAAPVKGGLAGKLLSPGIPIIAGAADFIMALAGTATLEPGMACDRTGSSEGINVCASAVPAAPAASRNIKGAQPPNVPLRILPHVRPGLWNLGAVIPQSGMLLDKYRSSSGQDEKPYNELVRSIFADPSHPGKIVLETIGRSFVKALDDLESAGLTVHELTLSGGQCADPLWNQYKADISGRILRVPEIIHAELAGNALLCEAAFSGKSITEKAPEMIRVRETFTPKDSL